MKYSISICDDEQIQVDIIRGYLDKLVEEFDFHIQVLTANNGEELLTKLQINGLHYLEESTVQVFFLDIEMPGMDGVELGKKIKETCSNPVIIFITGFSGYALEAFELRAFHYLLKPLTYQKFKSLFLEFLETKASEPNINQEKFLLIENKDSIHKILYKDILYFEKCLRKIKVFFNESVIEFYGSFKELKDKLPEDIFTQCHQGYIVNLNKISSYKNQTVYFKTFEMSIPVSRSYINTVKNSLLNQLLS